MNGLCLSDENCQVFDKPTGLSGQTMVGDSLCDACHRRIQSDVAGLRYDYVDLSQRIPRSGSAVADAQICRPKPESSPPLDVMIHSLRHDIAAALDRWGGHLRAHLRDHQVTPRTREGWRVDRQTAYLQPRIQALAGLPEVVDFHDGVDAPMVGRCGLDGLWQLQRLHRHARAACGLGEPRQLQRVPGTCPECHAEALRLPVGASVVGCAHCGHSEALSGYRDRVGLLGSRTGPSMPPRWGSELDGLPRPGDPG